MTIDTKLFIRAKLYLLNPTDEEIEEMALVMLKMNRRKILYTNILNRPIYLKNSLIYELQKCVKEREPYLTAEQRKEVAAALGEKEYPDDDDDDPSADSGDAPATADEMGENAAADADKKLMADVEKELKVQLNGQRKDHAELPKEVQEWLEGSKKRWFEMRDLHASLQTMDAATDEERAPYVKQLRKCFADYRKCLNDYDHYQPKGQTQTPTVNIAQKVATARKYLSDNRSKLADAMKFLNQEKADTLRAKMQERVNLILAEGLGFDDNFKEQLTNLGLNFD